MSDCASAVSFARISTYPMENNATTEVSTRRFRVRPRYAILGIIAFALFLWFFFFDSYSVIQRYRWGQEKQKLMQENGRLKIQIQQLGEQLGKLDSTEVIEKHAREDFGMRREGETVYRVVKPDTTGNKE